MSDPKSEIAKAFGVTRVGGFLPSRRVTFVIDAAGVVQRVIAAELDIRAHTKQALKALEELG